MSKVIYVDFDGVLVDTPKYIKKEIEINGNITSTFINIKWDDILLKCNELSNNIDYIKKIYKNNNIIILTHVYSEYEKVEKKKFIKQKIGNINVIAVPYNIKKCEFVSAKDNILIDDYDANINYWKGNGGIGLLFNDKMKLEDILKKHLTEV